MLFLNARWQAKAVRFAFNFISMHTLFNNIAVVFIIATVPFQSMESLFRLLQIPTAAVEGNGRLTLRLFGNIYLVL
uniref:7TM_GPCR_Srx domain-containing protein n=1 Tax=Angiostrongylus cantonensis TaxID=6313 RepID=A0A0K0DJR7_ANGCA